MTTHEKLVASTALALATGVSLPSDEAAWPPGAWSVVREVAGLMREGETIGDLARSWLRQRLATLETMKAEKADHPL